MGRRVGSRRSATAIHDALQDIQHAITTLNANFIAFLSAASKTQALMRNNEQNNIDRTQHMTERTACGVDAALAQAEKETRDAKVASKDGQATTAKFRLKI